MSESRPSSKAKPHAPPPKGQTTFTRRMGSYTSSGPIERAPSDQPIVQLTEESKRKIPIPEAPKNLKNHHLNRQLVGQTNFFMDLILQVQKKFEDLMSLLNEVGRHSCVFPPLYYVNQLLEATLQKISTEAYRIGAFKKRLKFLEARDDIQVKELSLHTKATLELIRRGFMVLQEFMNKYMNGHYSIALYINMNRIVKAEKDLKDARDEINQLKRICSFLRIQNFGFLVNSSTRWLKKARITLAFDKQGNEPLQVDQGVPEPEESATPYMTSGLGFGTFKKTGAGLDLSGGGGSIFRKGGTSFGFGQSAAGSGTSGSGDRASFGMGLKGKQIELVGLAFNRQSKGSGTGTPIHEEKDSPRAPILKSSELSEGSPHSPRTKRGSPSTGSVEEGLERRLTATLQEKRKTSLGLEEKKEGEKSSTFGTRFKDILRRQTTVKIKEED